MIYTLLWKTSLEQSNIENSESKAMKLHELQLLRKWVRAEILSVIQEERSGKLDKWGEVSEEYKDSKDKADLLFYQIMNIMSDE